MRRAGSHTLNADTNMAALQGYTIPALQGLERSPAILRLHHVGGVTIATDQDRLDFLTAERAKHRIWALRPRSSDPMRSTYLNAITMSMVPAGPSKTRWTDTWTHRAPLIGRNPRRAVDAPRARPFARIFDQPARGLPGANRSRRVGP
jgi:hypothetical protein